MFTTQKQIIADFKKAYPTLDYKNREYNGTEYTTDTRLVFLDHLRYLEDSKQISPELAARATLRPPKPKAPPKPRPSHVSGRRWFDAKNGNTYNSVTIHLSNLEKIYLPIAYGYGDYFIQRAVEYIKEHYKFKNPDNLSGTRYLYEIVKCNYSVTDVRRQKDL